MNSMRCDKCRKKFKQDWVVGDSHPRYGIYEETGCGFDAHSPINLCMECSQLFKEWLSEEPEEDSEAYTR